MLRYQQYIELVRTQSDSKLLEALIHAKKYLVPFRDVYPREFSQASGLLAFAPSQQPPAYDDIWAPERWAELADLFVSTHHQLLSLPASPLLHIALSSGLSSLKTPACHSAALQQQPARMSDNVGPLAGGVGGPLASSVCPICSIELNDLARGVPYAHHSKSHVEHDLMLLPNNRVYGKARLEDYAQKAALPQGVVKDLRTGDVYPVSKLKKVFIT
jgi:macrophage erythroblast attacher